VRGGIGIPINPPYFTAPNKLRPGSAGPARYCKSDHRMLGKTEISAIAPDDDMIQNPDIKQISCSHKHLCHVLIGHARLNIPGWMIMGQNERVGIGQQRTLEHLSRMDQRRIKRAPADHFNPEHMVFRIQ